MAGQFINSFSTLNEEGTPKGVPSSFNAFNLCIRYR